MAPRSLLILSLLAIGLLGAGCGGDGDEGDGGGDAGGFTKASEVPKDIVAQIPGRPLFEQPQAPGTYVGSAGPERDPAVAFVVQDDRVVVYVCDGKDADWFAGAVDDGRFALESEKGTRVRGTVTARSATGTVVFAGGQELKYAATPPATDRPRTGLFAFDDPTAEGSKARWIVTRDGARGLSLSATGTGTSSLSITRTPTGSTVDTRFWACRLASVSSRARRGRSGGLAASRSE